MPVVEIDLRPGSEYRERQRALTDQLYGIVSFPRSGHNWLSRMLAEIIKVHCGHSTPAALGTSGGMGAYVGLRCPRPSQVAERVQFYEPFPVVYGSHGHKLHDGFDPTTRCYLRRGFWAVWRSTRKANMETGVQRREQLESRLAHVCKAGTLGGYSERLKLREQLANLKRGQSWWGKSFLDCLIKWCKHRWAFRHAPMQITYEELKRDTRGVLRKICDHMGVCDVEEETLDAALRAGSRKNMLREQELYGSPNPFQTVNES